MERESDRPARGGKLHQLSQGGHSTDPFEQRGNQFRVGGHSIVTGPEHTACPAWQRATGKYRVNGRAALLAGKVACARRARPTRRVPAAGAKFPAPRGELIAMARLVCRPYDAR
jgi:hypothetical protein